MGTVEEFEAGYGTFEDDGSVYSSVLGKDSVDASSRKAIVSPFKRVRMLARGDLVIGKVIDLSEQMAFVEIDGISTDSRAILKIFDLQPGFTKTFREFLRVGDVVRARVKEANAFGVNLTTAEPGLGVLVAYCSRCRRKMNSEGRVFACSCGSREVRKMGAREF
jgi:exosome complex component CSL4